MIKFVARVIIFCLIVTGGIMYFSSVTDMSQSGATISKLKQELNQLDHQNQLLVSDISETYLLDNVEMLALANGLVANNKFVFVKTPSSLVVSRK